MNAVTKRLTENQIIIIGVKIIFCGLIVAWLFGNLFINGIDEYTTFKEYSIQNNFSESVSAAGVTNIEQKFQAPGNIISNISLYFGNIENQNLSIKIIDSSNVVIEEKDINLATYNANSWNRVAIESNKLHRGEQYSVSLSGSNLSSVVLSTSNSCSRYIGTCSLDGNESTYTLAIGFQFTYKYWLLGNSLELLVKILFVTAIASALCYTIISFEKIYSSFKRSEKRQGFLYALFFSVYTVLLFNPIDSSRTEATEFVRVMGAGLNAGVDVAKRISNFNHWFVCFAIAFCLFYLLADYLKNKEYSGESEKTIKFLDNVIVIANVVLGFRCITYFYNETQITSPFYYSDFILMLIILLAIGYVLLKLEEKISVDKFEALLVCGWMLALPVSIIITHEWTLGRKLMGFQVIVSILIIAAMKLIKIDWNRPWILSSICVCTAILSFIPFFTSFYIELVTLLNQHGIYWVHIRRNYFFAIVIGLIVVGVTSAILVRSKKLVSTWKNIAYPAIILGFSCLWVQISISSTYYNADLLELANSSVPISGFLNFGDIPIVQHYSGHMMFGVWEGIIYALLNNDFMGANFTPYFGYMGVGIVLVFYYFMKNIWNEDSAVLVVLFFPFYDSISYWGIGILTILSAMNYIRKNTYARAVLFWFTVIWCALLRLDIGFAFALACMIAMLLYIVADKNKKALHQLAITLLGWGIIGGGAWCIICLVKGINPITRLIEFLMISLSNQNWAYSGIGDMSITKFAFVYIIMPFAVVVMLVYTICRKCVKENVGTEKWAALIILGFSYFFNFSRSLVRHSLVENDLSVCFWSALIFIAVFITFVKKNNKVFLPTFAICILCCTLFRTESNFSGNCIANMATTKIGIYTETWSLDRFAEENTVEGEKPMTYWEQLKETNERIERVIWSTDLAKTIQNYSIMIDTLLEADETFVDCINKTSIYPLLCRKNPAYVSQSPLQLSGQFTQEEFIKEIQGVPIVLMPYDESNEQSSEALDGVANLYRYYKVFEYIYQNYVPLCTYENSYAIWCLPERYDSMATKVKWLAENIACNCKLADYGYDGPYLGDDGVSYSYLPFIHNYELDRLPLIWAEGDKEKSINNPIVSTLKYADGVYKYDLRKSDYGADGNYLKININYDGTDKAGNIGNDDEYMSAILKVGKFVNGKFETKYHYTFSVKEGQHDYMFRISNDYYWYLDATDAVTLECGDQIQINRMEILEGD